MKSVASEKGQVTIPKQLRDRLGIGPGQELDFTDEDGLLVARKVGERGAVDAVYGILALPGGTDALIDELGRAGRAPASSRTSSSERTHPYRPTACSPAIAALIAAASAA